MTPVVSSTKIYKSKGFFVLTAKKMLVILFNVVHNRTSNLDFGKEIKISQNEEYLAVLFKVSSHIILEYKQVVFVFICASTNATSLCLLNLILLMMVSVAQGENVVSDLQDHHWKVNLR